MAYTVEITDGVSVYTFGVTTMPSWSIATETEYDQTKYPPVLMKKTDTLTLKDCSYRSSTPSNVTDDWDTLQALLFDRLTPITSVALKDGVTTIQSLTSSTHNQLMITSMTPDAEVGFLANHWLGTIVVTGIDLKGDASGVVKKMRRFSYSWDSEGFETRSVDVDLETLPGTSAATRIESEKIELPSSNWFYVTNADNGINYALDEDSEDTKARGVSTVKEQALSIPSQANLYSLVVSTTESGTGKDKKTTYTITAQADTLANARTAADVGAPTSYQTKTVNEDRTKNRVTATYVAGEPDVNLPDVKAYSLSVSDSGQGLEVIQMPGGNPVIFKKPRKGVQITEMITISKKGFPSESLELIPTALLQFEDYLNEEKSSDVTALVSEGNLTDADVWERSVKRVFIIPNADDVTKAIYNGLDNLSIFTGRLVDDLDSA